MCEGYTDSRCRLARTLPQGPALLYQCGSVKEETAVIAPSPE
jgi:hypothetical protein